MRIAGSRWLRALALAAGLLAGAPALAASLTLPGAGPVAAVETTPLRDGYDQRIRFGGGDGANSARVVVHNETADLALAFPSDMAKPEAAGIATALHARFPGRAMSVRQPRRNAYGPVGIAVGADCVFAWQWIELSPPSLTRAGPARGAASIRIRLCRTEQASLPDLIASIERMSLDRSGPTLAVSGLHRQRIAPQRPRRTLARRPVRAPSPERAAKQGPDEAGQAAGTAPARAVRIETPVAGRPALPVEPLGRPTLAPLAGQPRALPPGSPSQRYITEAVPGAEPSARPRTPTPPPAPKASYGDRFTPNLPAQATQPPAN